MKGKLNGTAAAHRGEFSARYMPAKVRAGVLGEAPAQADIAFTGGWGRGPAGDADAALTGWRGTFSRLNAESAGFAVAAERPPVRGLPARGGRAAMAVAGRRHHARPDAAGQERLALAHKGSRGGGARWETAGQADNLVITAAATRQVIAAIDRGRRPAGQGPQAGQRHGGRSQAPHRARCVLGPEVRWPSGRLGPSPAATATC